MALKQFSGGKKRKFTRSGAALNPQDQFGVVISLLLMALGTYLIIQFLRQWESRNAFYVFIILALVTSSLILTWTAGLRRLVARALGAQITLEFEPRPRLAPRKHSPNRRRT